MGGISTNMDAFVAGMIQDCGELLGMIGIDAQVVCVPVPRVGFWQRLRTEIANRPRVF